MRLILTQSYWTTIAISITTGPTCLFSSFLSLFPPSQQPPSTFHIQQRPLISRHPTLQLDMPAYDTSPAVSPILDSYYDPATPRPGDYFSDLHHRQPSSGSSQQAYPGVRPPPVETHNNIHFVNPFQQRPTEESGAAHSLSPISPATTTSRPHFHHTSTAPHPARSNNQTQSFSQPSRPSFHHQGSVPTLQYHHQQRQYHSLSSGPAQTTSGTPHKINRTPSGFFRPSPGPASADYDATLSDSSFSSSLDSSFDHSLLTPGTTPVKSYFPSPSDQKQPHHQQPFYNSSFVNQKPSLTLDLPVDPFAASVPSYDTSPTSYILPSESSGLIYLSDKKRADPTSPPRSQSQQQRSHPYSPEMKDGRLVVRVEGKVAVDCRIDRQKLLRGRAGYLQPAGVDIRIKRGRKYCHF